MGRNFRTLLETQSTILYLLTSSCLKLKRKLQRELDNARVARLRHLPEAAEKSKGGIRISRDQELSVIERVEELRAELQVGPLRELEVLEDRQINVVNPRPPDRVTSGIAECEEWNGPALASRVSCAPQKQIVATSAARPLHTQTQRPRIRSCNAERTA